MPPPAILHAGRGRGQRRRKQKVEIIHPATIGEDDVPAASEGIDIAEGLSLFSGDSLFGSAAEIAAGMLSMGDGADARAPSKDGGKATTATHLRSDVSMMSELTDLSDAASKMSIGR